MKNEKKPVEELVFESSNGPITKTKLHETFDVLPHLIDVLKDILAASSSQETTRIGDVSTSVSSRKAMTSINTVSYPSKNKTTKSTGDRYQTKIHKRAGTFTIPSRNKHESGRTRRSHHRGQSRITKSQVCLWMLMSISCSIGLSYHKLYLYLSDC